MNKKCIGDKSSSKHTFDATTRELAPVYNKGGALDSLKLGTTTYVAAIAYNARGQRLLMAMGNGMMTRYTYDLNTFRAVRTKSEKFTFANLTFTANSGTQQDLAYTYDLEGTITSQRDRAPRTEAAQGPGDQLRTFTHDPLRRLLSATGRESSNVYAQPSWDLNIRPQNRLATNDYTRSYEYDKIGNIQSLKHVATGAANQDFVRTYKYDAPANNHLTSFTVATNNFTNTYDANGNLTKEGTTRYLVWSQSDKSKITSSARPVVFYNRVGTSTPTVFTHYFYNAKGDRVKKLTRKGQQLEVTVYVDGGLFELSYVKLTGTTIDPANHYNTLHVLDGTSRISTVRVGNDANDPTPAIKYYLEDHLMDNLVVLTTTGALVNREEFYPFGETSFGGYGKKRYRYSGKEKDSESGLYYYGARYYAPWLCRFISVDPLKDDYPYLTPYNYAGNKPITHKDIDGLQSTGDKPVNKEGIQTTFPKNEWSQKSLESAPKSDVSNWNDLINYKPNQILVNAADKRVSPNDKGGVKLQDIESASGSLNVDIYSVTISQFPEGITPEQFLENFRTNLNDFIAGGGSTFEPYSKSEGEKFQSNSPDGALMRFKVYLIGVNVDDLSVIASETNASSWVFSPVSSPEDMGHPVAGNRQFGITENEDGTHTFYIRGADRPWSGVDAFAEKKVFEGADKLWKTAINNATNYINERGGKATVQSTFSKQIK